MRTLLTLVRACFHGALLFVLPWLVGALVGAVFDVGEVAETSGRFAQLFALFAVPLLALTAVGIAVKVGRELRSQKRAGRRGFSMFVTAVDRHVRVLSGRGVGLAAVALFLVALSLSARWAQLGVLAVAALGLLYLFSTTATVVSAFFVRGWDERLRRRRGVVARELVPPLVEAGDPVEERFVLERVPVPPLFRLHIAQRLPARLGCDTRFAIDRGDARAHSTVGAPLARTPRGVYRLGPANIRYEDVLGLTRVHVAAHAEATFRALPRVRPLILARAPTALERAEGTLTQLSIRPTEDHFKTREYVRGDDLRRVHWKLSLKAGDLIVRVPEAVPFAPTRVRLVLDTYLPPLLRHAAGELDDALDLLVEAWIGLAHALLRRGERVSLAVALPTADGGAELREIACRRGEERVFRALGAEVAWQSAAPLVALAARLPDDGARAIAFTAGLSPLDGARLAGSSLVLVEAARLMATPVEDPLTLGERLLFFRFPVGADDNAIDLAALLAPKPKPPPNTRALLAAGLTSWIEVGRAAGATVLCARRHGAAIAVEAP